MRIIAVKEEWPEHHMAKRGIVPPLIDEILSTVDSDDKGVVLDDEDRLVLGLKNMTTFEQSLRRYAAEQNLRLSIHNDRADDGSPVLWVRKHPQQRKPQRKHPQQRKPQRK